MKRKVFLTVVALAFVLSAFAQGGKGRRFNPAEFKAKMEAFVSEHAGLTAAESEKLLPLFEEMKEKQRKLKGQEHKLRKECCAAETEMECQEILEKIVKLHVKASELEETYYNKMCKAVSARKAYRVMQADDAFHREMLQNFGGRGNGREQKHAPRARH